MELGQLLKQARLDAGLSQRQLLVVCIDIFLVYKRQIFLFYILVYKILR